MTILLAVDPSEGSRAAAEFLHRLVSAERVVSAGMGRLTMLHVLQRPTFPVGYGTPSAHTRRQLATLRRDQRRDAEEWLHTMQRPFEEAGWATTLVLKEGDAATHILRLGAHQDVRLTVLGTHGQSAITKFLLGSVSEQVLASSKTSVLLVRQRGAPPRAPRILVAVDDSRESQYAARLLSELRWPRGASLILVHVVDTRSSWLSAIYGATNRDAARVQRDLIRERRARAERILTDVASHVFRRHPSECKVLVGHPAQVILTFARQRHADLIVVGSRGMSGMPGMLLGGVSRKVATYASCSVLVARERR